MDSFIISSSSRNHRPMNRLRLFIISFNLVSNLKLVAAPIPNLHRRWSARPLHRCRRQAPLAPVSSKALDSGKWNTFNLFLSMAQHIMFCLLTVDAYRRGQRSNGAREHNAVSTLIRACQSCCPNRRYCVETGRCHVFANAQSCAALKASCVITCTDLSNGGLVAIFSALVTNCSDVQ